MKKTMKVICVIVTALVMLMMLSNMVFAAWDFKGELTSLDEETGTDVVNKTTNNIVGSIVNVIRIVGTGVAIIMITYVAIKYMTAAPQEKAEFKKSATAYIVGAIVLFATTNIIGVISKFAASNI